VDLINLPIAPIESWEQSEEVLLKLHLIALEKVLYLESADPFSFSREDINEGHGLVAEQHFGEVKVDVLGTSDQLDSLLLRHGVLVHLGVAETLRLVSLVLQLLDLAPDQKDSQHHLLVTQSEQPVSLRVWEEASAVHLERVHQLAQLTDEHMVISHL